jgi:Protein of unknown function (DUF3260).
VPEHGDNLRGDRMQIPGMRDIPSAKITHVPVGIKLIGFDSPGTVTAPIHVTAPSSFLALSDLVARLLQQKHLSRTKGFNWSTVLSGLPVLPDWIAENGGVVVMKHAGVPYVRLKRTGGWQPYPQ